MLRVASRSLIQAACRSGVLSQPKVSLQSPFNVCINQSRNIIYIRDPKDPTNEIDAEDFEGITFT